MITSHRLLVLFLWGVCAVSWAQTGPVALRERNPLFAFFLTPYAEDTAVKPGWRLDLDAGFSNIFERQINDRHFQDVDMEQSVLILTPRYGWNHLQVGADVSIRQRGGGFLDHGIQEFHALFGLPNDSREDVANGRYSFLFQNPDGSFVGLPKESAALDDLTLFVKYRLSSTKSFPLAVKFSTNVDMADNDGGADAGDTALQFFTERTWTRWSWYGSVGMVFLNPHQLLEPIVRDTAVIGSTTAECRTPYGFSLMTQIDLGSSYFQNTGLTNLDDPPVNFTIAVSGNGDRFKRWRVYFAEDLTGDGPAVDFTLGFNATFQ